MRTGKERSARIAVMKIPQIVSGSRPIDRPRARMLMMVVRKLRDPNRAEIIRMRMATSHSVWPSPEAGDACGTAESGAYEVHPLPAGPPGTKKEASRTSTEGTKVQNDIMLRTGNAMSGAPIIRGMRKLPKAPVRIDVRKKKIITVPCIVAA